MLHRSDYEHCGLYRGVGRATEMDPRRQAGAAPEPLPSVARLRSARHHAVAGIGRAKENRPAAAAAPATSWQAGRPVDRMQQSGIQSFLRNDFLQSRNLRAGAASLATSSALRAVVLN